MSSYKVLKKQQSLGATILSKTDASSATDGSKESKFRSAYGQSMVSAGVEIQRVT